MSKQLQSLFFLISFFVCMGTVNATTLIMDNQNEPSLQDIFHFITDDGYSSVDVHTDQMPDSYDSYWSIFDFRNTSAFFVTELGYYNQNTFGIFSGSDFIELFQGEDTTGDRISIEFMDDGSVWKNGIDTLIDFQGNQFGFYIGTHFQEDYIFYSDTTLNSDGHDHMVAYQGQYDMIQMGAEEGLIQWTPDKYMIAFEDQLDSGDRDFQDMIIFIETPVVVPEPVSSLLFVVGGLIFASRWYKKKRTLLREE